MEILCRSTTLVSPDRDLVGDQRQARRNAREAFHSTGAGLGGATLDRSVAPRSQALTNARRGVMRTVQFTRELAQPITLFDSDRAVAVPLGDGFGEAHVYWIHIAAGGCIGAHPAGFGQLFLVIAGSGWIAGADGVRVAVSAGQGAHIERGEYHSKGSESGLAAIMVQVGDLTPR